MITGGEPMLFPTQLVHQILEIKRLTQVPVYLYTAKVDEIETAVSILNQVEGMTVTLHQPKDVAPFMAFHKAVMSEGVDLRNKKLRLNVFHNVIPPEVANWTIRSGIQWKKDCPLPEGEVFQRLRKVVS